MHACVQDKGKEREKSRLENEEKRRMNEKGKEARKSKKQTFEDRERGKEQTNHRGSLRQKERSILLEERKTRQVRPESKDTVS